MKALTLWRPWPAAIIHLGKPLENRSWPPPESLIGQRLAIHAGKMIDPNADDLCHELESVGDPSQIVCVVTIEGWIFSAEGKRMGKGVEQHRAIELMNSKWFCGPFGWVFLDKRELPEPITCRGAQGLWTVPAIVELQINNQLEYMTAVG